MRVRQDLAIAESQLRDYRERLGKPFPHEKYLSELTELRDRLKAGLSASAHEASEGKGPGVSDLAERIRGLRAANTIEATPQRARQKRSSAEESVTTRIRRQLSEAGEVVHKDDDVGETLLRAAGQDSSSKPPLTFQERISLERQHKDQGPSRP